VARRKQPKNSAAVRGGLAADKRRPEVARLYLEGAFQTDIAEQLGVTQATISRDLARIRKEWISSATVNYNEAVAKELARIDNVEREAWEAWRRSQQDAVQVRSGVQAEKSTDVTIRTGQTGNPAYMRVILECVKQRCDILGITQPGGEARIIGRQFNVQINQEARAAVTQLENDEQYLEYLRSCALDSDASPVG